MRYPGARPRERTRALVSARDKMFSFCASVSFQ